MRFLLSRKMLGFLFTNANDTATPTCDANYALYSPKGECLTRLRNPCLASNIRQSKKPLINPDSTTSQTNIGLCVEVRD